MEIVLLAALGVVLAVLFVLLFILFGELKRDEARIKEQKKIRTNRIVGQTTQPAPVLRPVFYAPTRPARPKVILRQGDKEIDLLESENCNVNLNDN